MAYTQKQAMDFWYEFDQTFLFDRTPEVNRAFGLLFHRRGGGLMDQIVDLARDHSGVNLAEQFDEQEKQGLLKLAEIQLRIMEKYFPNLDGLQEAFEDFGQGVLLDTPDRRLEGSLIHMMDGKFSDNSCVGYHRWHAFIKSFLAIGAPYAEAWHKVNYLVSLAWAIQSEQDPQLDVKNSPMPSARLAAFREQWLQKSEFQLDQLFFSYTGTFPTGVVTKAPSLSLASSASALLAMSAIATAAASSSSSNTVVTFNVVRRLLNQVTGNGHPGHQGKRDFWNKPLTEVLDMKVYGRRVIAPDNTEKRGANSALVQALRGTLSGTPRMPLNRPPMADDQIDQIERWIDAGCPESPRYTPQ